MKNKKNKGFTLVELIVVLVILAILAAIMVPALLGYIDRAKDQQNVLNGKSVLTAAQAEMSSLYATGKKALSKTEVESKVASKILATADVPNAEEVVIGCEKAIAAKYEHDMFTVTYVKYVEGGKTIVFNGEEWVTVHDGETAPTAPTATYTIKAAAAAPATSGS